MSVIKIIKVFLESVKESFLSFTWIHVIAEIFFFAVIWVFVWLAVFNGAKVWLSVLIAFGVVLGGHLHGFIVSFFQNISEKG